MNRCFFKVQTREERPLFKLYRGIISFHSHLLSNSCMSDCQDKFMEQLFCFILIFTGEPVKQMSLNVARVWLGEGRIILLLRSLNTKTCYQSFWNIFSWKLFENRIDSLLPKGGIGVQGFVQWFQNRTVSGLLG